MKVLRNNLFILGIAWKAAPVYTFKRMLDMVKHRTVVFIEHVYMIGFIINAIIEQRPFIEAAGFIIAVFVGVALIVNLLDTIFGCLISPNAEQLITKAVRMKLYEKASRIDMKCYDDPEYYNNFVWAMSEAGTRTEKVLTDTSDLIGNTVGLLITGGYILSNDAVGIIVVAVSFVGMFLCSLLRNKYKLDLNERMKPHERKRDYTSRVMYLVDYAKEIRLNRIKKKLYVDYDGAIDELRREAEKGTRRIVACDFMINFVFDAFAIDGVYLAHLLYSSIVKKMFPYGTLVTLFNT